MFGLWWIFIGVISCGVLALIINMIMNTIENRKNGYKRLCPDEWVYGWCTLGVTVVVALGIFLPICIFLPLKAHEEVIKYRYDYEMVQEGNYFDKEYNLCRRWLG